MSGEKSNRIYEIYKNEVMPHGHHNYSKKYDTEKATMCAYNQSDHALTHRKCVIRWCAYCPWIIIPDQETDYQYSDTPTSIRFHIYHIIARCTVHVRIPLKDKKVCHMFNNNIHQTNLEKYTPEKN